MNHQIVTDPSIWDNFIQNNLGHPLQLWGWGELKAAHGWQVHRTFISDKDKTIGAAQVLVKPLPSPFKSLCYIPRGPVIVDKHQDKILSSIADFARSMRSTLVKIEPAWDLAQPIPKGWRLTKNRILLSYTALLDLSQSEDDLLAAMSSKTRQYIRKSAKSVIVRRTDKPEDINKCLEIYADTARRANFDLHDESYYRDLLKFLGSSNYIYVAEVNRQIVAFLWLVSTAGTAFELYGGVSDLGQSTRANFILKWTAIQSAKSGGVRTYDMNGLLNDGVSSFKLGFTGSLETNFIGSLDYPLSPAYHAWNTLLPAAKSTVRRFKRIIKK